MPNSGKQKGEKRKQRPSEMKNDTVIVGLEVYEKIRNEVSKIYEMEAKGRLAKAVKIEDYIKIKAYNNKDLTKKSPQGTIGNKESKESDDRGH